MFSKFIYKEKTRFNYTLFCNQFFSAEFLGVSNLIYGCAGRTVGQAMIRRWLR